ncbi:MAG: DUF4435 domain-containing protein [Methylomonas sp.]|nr:DUF4435 domain-containing protein [Methylomonas sp.]PPD21714.1 MAG: hypothetical protein CTY23_04940 [Methylomonas sp.]
MSKTDDRIKDIREQQIGNSAKRALIVEGADDVDAFQSFLGKAHPGWEQKWVIAEGGKKTEVLAIIRKEPNWIGVVDRDEWSAPKIAELETELTNLWFLPRYCIENYLLVPEELWGALPENQQNKIAGGLVELTQSITNDLARWRCHGVLWSVINPMWEGLRSLGFKEALLDPAIATNEAEIKAKLQEWHDYLEPDPIWQSYQDALAQAVQLPVDEQLKRLIHGKYFYEQVVNPLLNQLLGQKSATDRQKAIFRTLPVPDDLGPLWQKMGLIA